VAGRDGSIAPSAWAGDDGPAARRAARVATAVAAVGFLLLATGGRPWHVFDRGPFTSDFFDVQGRALSRGHLTVPPAVASIEGFVVDGHTHLYFGIVPALVRLPVVAFTHALDGRLVLVSMLAGFVVGCLAAARLLQRAREALVVAVPERSWPWVTGGFVATVGLSSPLLFLSSRALVYHETELWGAALAVLGFERVVVWWSRRRSADLVSATVVSALAMATRGSSGVGPALALGGLAVVVATRRAWREAAVVGGAAVASLVPYVAVNLARFHTPFAVPYDHQVLNSFSAHRRAVLAANHDSLFGFQFLPTTVLQYLRPDTVTPRALAPWVSWGHRADVIGDVTFDVIDRSASLPVTAPLLVILAVVGVVVLVRHRPPAAWAMALAAAAVSVVPTLTFGLILQRYLADFVPALVVGAALGTPVAARWADATTSRRRSVTGVAAALLALSLFVNAGLAVLARYLYLLPTERERRDFVAAQYDVQDALGGGRPPYVVDVDALGAPAADGTVAIVGACDALFRSSGDAWVVLEQRPGGTQRATVRGDAPGAVVRGDGWQIVLEITGGERRLVYEGPARVVGPPIAGDGPIEVDVRADPTVPTVVVDVDGHRSFEAFLQPAGGPVVAAAGWTARPGGAPLCSSLQRRLH
jgi:hypothetical protein